MGLVTCALCPLLCPVYGLESQGQDQHGLSPGRGQDRERRGARRGLRLDDTEASSARHLRGFDLLHGAVSGGVRAVNERDASGSATASPVPEQGHHHHADHRAEQDHHHHAAHRAGTPQSRTRAGPSSPRCPAGRDPAGQRQEGAMPDDRSRVASRPPPLRVSGALIGGARQQPRGRCRDGARRRVEATGLTLSRRGDTPRHVARGRSTATEARISPPIHRSPRTRAEPGSHARPLLVLAAV
ncbi:unnamed protein product [Lampetra fluviatilis]